MRGCLLRFVRHSPTPHPSCLCCRFGNPPPSSQHSCFAALAKNSRLWTVFTALRAAASRPRQREASIRSKQRSRGVPRPPVGEPPLASRLRPYLLSIEQVGADALVRPTTKRTLCHFERRRSRSREIPLIGNENSRTPTIKMRFYPYCSIWTI